jgi:hypothetical protein
MRISEDEYQCLHCNGMGDLPSRALGAGVCGAAADPSAFGATEKGQPQERSASHQECRYCGGTGLMTEAQHENYYGRDYRDRG